VTYQAKTDKKADGSKTITETDYNADGSITTITHPYDPTGQLTSHSQTDTKTDGSSTTTQTVYHADGTSTTTHSTTQIVVHPDGSTTKIIRKYDEDGNLVEETDIDLVVSSSIPLQAPGLALDPGSDTGFSSTDGITADATPLVTGTAAPGATVTVFADSTALGTAVAGSSGQWSFACPQIADGKGQRGRWHRDPDSDRH
jgi:YD repeat-containing protein